MANFTLEMHTKHKRYILFLSESGTFKKKDGYGDNKNYKERFKSFSDDAADRFETVKKWFHVQNLDDLVHCIEFSSIFDVIYVDAEPEIEKYLPQVPGVIGFVSESDDLGTKLLG